LTPIARHFTLSVAYIANIYLILFPIVLQRET